MILGVAGCSRQARRNSRATSRGQGARPCSATLAEHVVERRPLGPAQRADGVHLHADGDGFWCHSHPPSRQQILRVGVETHTGPPERVDQLGQGLAAQGEHDGLGERHVASLEHRRTGSAGQEIGARTIRPYAMNAMRRPSTPLMTMGGISRYLTCTQMNTRLSIARTAAATTVSVGCQWQGGGDDQPDRADEFEDAEGHPGLPRQRTKGRDVPAHLVEQEDLHDARRSVQERGEDLQDPQQDVHRRPPPASAAA